MGPMSLAENVETETPDFGVLDRATSGPMWAENNFISLWALPDLNQRSPGVPSNQILSDVIRV